VDKLKTWWNNDLSKWAKFVLLALLANGLPAFLILMSVPNLTDILFVWTVKPAINARLMGVMYGNALLLVGFGVFQTAWARIRMGAHWPRALLMRFAMVWATFALLEIAVDRLDTNP